MTIAAVSGQDGGTLTLDSSSDTEAYSSSVLLGSLLVIWGAQVEADADTFVAGDCTQSAGTAVLSTIQLDASIQDSIVGANGVRSGIWSARVTTAGSCTMQIANGAGASMTACHIHEFSGSWDDSRLEDTATDTTDSQDTDAASGNATSAGAALFAGMVNTLDVVEVTTVEDVAYTEVGHGQGLSGAEITAESIYKIVGSGNTDSADWTLNDNFGWNAIQVVYKEVAAGGVIIPIFYHHYQRNLR